MRWGVAKGIKVVLIALVACTVMSYVVFRLWNWLMPEIFGLHTIRWSQALGLLVLSKILLGGFHKHSGGPSHFKQKAWKRRMKQKWDAMTPDERERFQQGMKQRWGDCRECLGWKPGRQQNETAGMAGDAR